MSDPNTAAAAASSVDLKLVNLTTLNTALKAAGIKVTSKMGAEQRVNLLLAYELKLCEGDEKLPEEQRKGGVCNHCGGVSRLDPEVYKECPFCGVGEEQPAPNSPAANPAPKSKKAAEAKAKATKPPKKPAKPKPSKEEKKALAKAAAGKVLKAHVAELDQMERRIQGLLKDGMSAQWKLGREINTVFTKGLFKYRIDDEGKPLHTFAGWCEANNLSPQYARAVMAVAANYTEDQVRDVGVTKLNVMLRAPSAARGELLEKAAGGASRSELEAEVRKIAPGATREPIAGGGDKARPGVAASNARRSRSAAASPSRVVKANEVTAVMALQRYEVPMFARAKSAESDQPLRAKNLASDPHAVLDLQNGVQLHIRWVEDETGLSSVVEFKRAADEAAAE